MASAFVGQSGTAVKLYTPIGKMICLQMLVNASGETTDGGVILPDTVQWISPVARVVAKGPKCEQVEEGDYLILNPNVRMQIYRHAGQELLHVNEDDLGGVFISKERPSLEKPAPKLLIAPSAN